MQNAEQQDAVRQGLPPSDDSEAVDINLAPYVRQLLRGRRTIGLFAFIGLLAGLAFSYTISPYYTAQASILPPGGSGSAALALASQLGSLGSSGILGGMKTPGDLYGGIMRSYTVQSEIVDRFHLIDVYRARNKFRAMRVLAKTTDIDIDTKTSILTIKVTDKNPVRAKDIANGYLDALEHANENLALSEASQRRAFFETQLEREKESLANAEVALKKSQEQTGLILPAGQATLQIDTISRVKAEIAGREVELASLRDSATDQNPEVIRIKSEIGDLNRQLGGLENGKAGPGNVPTDQVPELALESIRKQRDVKYHEALFDILARQYESARLDESKGPTLQVLDRATVPEEKSGPSRLLITLVAGVLASLMGIVWVVYSENRAALKTWADQFAG